MRLSHLRRLRLRGGAATSDASWIESPINAAPRYESDGTSFTDIITPSPSRRTRPEPDSANTETALDAPAAPRLVEVTAEGFIPGEDIGVAIIVTHTDASHTGRARALLESAQFDASPTGEVVLIGRLSGNYEIVRHP